MKTNTVAISNLQTANTNTNIYHTAVYMPTDLKQNTYNVMTQNLAQYGLTYSKHYIKRLNTHCSNRDFTSNDVTPEAMLKADIIQIRTVNDVVTKVLLMYNITDNKSLYLCVALDDVFKLITAYTHKNRAFNKDELIQQGKYITE